MKGKTIAVMATGIASIVIGWSWGSIFGLACAIVSMVLAKQVNESGEALDSTMEKFMKAGKITSIIGLIICGINLVVAISCAACMGCAAATGAGAEALQSMQSLM